MLDVLVQFRAFKVGLVSDIKKAFLNVAINEKDRNFLRILWIDNIHDPSPEIIIYRFARVLFGLNASLYLLVASIRKHLQKYKDIEPELIELILRCLYVGDNFGGGDEVDEVFNLYKRLKSIFFAAGLELRKWCSNELELQRKINESEMSLNKDDTTVKVKKITKVLGIDWILESDTLHI